MPERVDQNMKLGQGTLPTYNNAWIIDEQKLSQANFKTQIQIT